MCGRQIDRNEIFRLVLEIRGPKSEKHMENFREALKKLMEQYKVVTTEITYKAK